LLGGGGGSGIRTEGVMGSGRMRAVFGQAGMEHMRRYGTTQEQFAKVAVKNHKHSTKNPLSQYQNEVGLEDVLKARMVAYPNTLYMCCPTGDGAAAAVVVSPEKARQLGARVRVLSSVLTSDPWTERDLTLPDVSTLTRNAARKAYEVAGIGPEDLDLVELHDCFATAELLHYENLGLCRDGEAGRMIDEGETAHGGRIPVNVSGGLLSKGHPLGATGEPGPIALCHCGMCRKQSGTAFATNASVERRAFRLVRGTDLVQRYQSSPGKWRCFSSLTSPVRRVETWPFAYLGRRVGTTSRP